MIVGEFVVDADKRWKYTRMASIATALVSEAMYAAHLHKQEREREAVSEQERQCWRERVEREREGRSWSGPNETSRPEKCRRARRC